MSAVSSLTTGLAATSQPTPTERHATMSARAAGGGVAGERVWGWEGGKESGGGGGGGKESGGGGGGGKESGGGGGGVCSRVAYLW